ncbi:CHAT domain-containing protein [Kitasatospora sp. NPDC093550]|uniref:CHAT domain-containing protein n=1 Tax=Kitasatospora sp. NPDC093550 TaxID=3364089 RepID=UPI00381C3CA5
MPRDLQVVVRQNPSADYTRLPRQAGPYGPGEDPPAKGAPPLDLVVTLRRHGDELHMSAFRPGERTPRTRTHGARLAVSAPTLLARAARLRTVWRDLLIAYDPDPLAHPYPFASTVDFTPLAAVVERRVAELAEEGRYLLETMLEGPGRDLALFRDYLHRTLTEHGSLRISFDSDLHLPWPMLAVDAERPDTWADFLGYRHQVEQTGAAYPAIQPPYQARTKPVTSLNTDDQLTGVGRAPEVRKLLEDRSQLTVRTESELLLKALSCAVLDEDVMYFWCHGQFVANDSPYEQLAVRLSDDRHIDADLVRRHRRRHLNAPEAVFRPFVLLNACHTGQSAAAELEHLGRALVDLGADGVLGPQIQIPQEFAAEFAFAFLDLYLTGEFTAGEITQQLVQRFAREFHNPLALAYSLHCGIDSILELNP